MVQALRDSFNVPECLNNARVACTVHFKPSSVDKIADKMVAYGAKGNAAYLQVDDTIKQFPEYGFSGKQTVTTPEGYSRTTDRHGCLMEVVRTDGSVKQFDNEYSENSISVLHSY